MSILVKPCLFFIIGFGLYFLILKRHNDFSQRRYYLLLIACLGSLIPLSEFVVSSMAASSLPVVNFSFDWVGQVYPNAIESDVTSGGWTVWSVLRWIYYFVSGILLLRLLNELLGIIILIYRDRKDPYIRKESPDAFSFFGFTFIGEKSFVTNEEKLMIDYHENQHTKLFHSFDLVLFKILSVLFWFIPIWHFIIKEIRFIHEVQVDNKVIEKYDRVKYSELLVRSAMTKCGTKLIHSFGRETITKRLEVMLIKQGKIPFRTLLPVMLFCFGMFAILSCADNETAMIDETEVNDSDIDYNDVEKDEIFQVVEDQPRFPGCEEINDMADRKDCSIKELLAYIYSNIQYPSEARRAETEGTCIVTFVVHKTGKINNINILKNIGDGCGEEVLRVVNKMAEEKTWIPGEQRGRKVSVQYNLPVKFKLQG